MPNRYSQISALQIVPWFRRSLALAGLLVIGAALSACSSTETSRIAVSTVEEPVVSETFDEPEDIDSIRPEDVINRSRDHVTRTGEVYLMRGLANVFSRGIDTMADNMRERGMDASNFSYTHWIPIAQDIVSRQRRGRVSSPVVIVGHSLGANESTKFANFLAERGVKVDLVVSFDPVEAGYVGRNIGEVINYYLPKAEDNRIVAKPGFTGTIRNIDVTGDDEITHTNVEKRDRFQNQVMIEILERTRPLAARPRNRGRIAVSGNRN